MKTDHLVTMANQIGSFFESYPDQHEAATEIANHLARFWAPRMRLALLAHVDGSNGDGLHDTVLAAIRSHRAQLMPRADFKPDLRAAA
ncbi:MAG TPA: formate dehydrogenase subunit delta [Janthinobacterium sp.]|jgi:formate dehydrogenase subunit delta|nr:formate dehydrogenase subunit delta [Janthinobacterium sp.]